MLDKVRVQFADGRKLLKLLCPKGCDGRTVDEIPENRYIEGGEKDQHGE
jgi:hypothetical protein